MSDRQPDVVRRHTPQRSGDERLFNRALGANLRRARQDADMTQDQVAGLADITRGSVANIERGEQTPGLYRLLMICTAVGVQLIDILPEHTHGVTAVADTLGEEYASLIRKVKKQAERNSDRKATS